MTTEVDWQAMDTAPRDGTRVLIVRSGVVEISSYFCREYLSFGKLTNKYEGWSAPDAYARRLSEEPEPTAWAPLPSAPSTATIADTNGVSAQ